MSVFVLKLPATMLKCTIAGNLLRQKIAFLLLAVSKGLLPNKSNTLLFLVKALKFLDLSGQAGV